MVEYVRGRVISRAPTHVVVEAGGIGYRLLIPVSTFEKIPAEGEVRLLAHLYVREDEMRLYGFATEGERALFELLMSVPGVGPATALLVLSSGGVEDIQAAIVEGRTERLERVKGIGKKTSQRIILELKGYLEQVFAPAEGGKPRRAAFSDAVLALAKLGYPRRTAEHAVQKAEDRLQGAGSVEELVRESLKHI